MCCLFLVVVVAAAVDVFIFSEGSLEVKLVTIWTDEKQRSKPEEKVKEEKRREEQVRESQKREDAVVRMFCRPRGSKSKLAKAADAEPAGQMRDEQCRAVVTQNAAPSRNVRNT